MAVVRAHVPVVVAVDQRHVRAHVPVNVTTRFGAIRAHVPVVTSVEKHVARAHVPLRVSTRGVGTPRARIAVAVRMLPAAGTGVRRLLRGRRA